jgi:hypothetical protein
MMIGLRAAIDRAIDNIEILAPVVRAWEARRPRRPGKAARLVSLLGLSQGCSIRCPSPLRPSAGG